MKVVMLDGWIDHDNNRESSTRFPLTLEIDAAGLGITAAPTHQLANLDLI
jgi:hypothetical protein